MSAKEIPVAETFSAESVEIVPLSGPWSYRIRRYIAELRPLSESERAGRLSYRVGVPGIHFCAETQLLRDGKRYGASHRDVSGATAEERESKVSKRLERARKSKVQA